MTIDRLKKLDALLNSPSDINYRLMMEEYRKIAYESAKVSGQPVQNEAAFSYGAVPLPHAFLQWKGTDACFDFNCKCGSHCHFDGEFAYYVRCAHCKTVWQMPFNLFPREANPGDREVVDLDEDLDATGVKYD